MLKISDTILSKNPLIKIKNMKQLNKFSKTYGDVSFLLILNEILFIVKILNIFII